MSLCKMEELIRQMKQAPIPYDQLHNLFNKVLPSTEKKGALPWARIMKSLFSRVAKSKSKFFYVNAHRLLKCYLLKTVEKAQRLPKITCQKYSMVLGNLLSHVHYAFEDTDVSSEDIQNLTSLLFAAVIDLTAMGVEEYHEADVVSKIYIKLTLMLGSSPHLILDVLLQCKTLIYSNMRKSRIYEPLIKQLFNNFKMQTSDPELYLKYLLLGKLLIFMADRSQVSKTRIYVIKSLPMPHSFAKWKQQKDIAWLKEEDKNTQIILKRMSVSAALQTLYKSRSVLLKAAKSSDHKKEKGTKEPLISVCEKDLVHINKKEPKKKKIKVNNEAENEKDKSKGNKALMKQNEPEEVVCERNGPKKTKRTMDDLTEEVQIDEQKVVEISSKEDSVRDKSKNKCKSPSQDTNKQMKAEKINPRSNEKATAHDSQTHVKKKRSEDKQEIDNEDNSIGMKGQEERQEFETPNTLIKTKNVEKCLQSLEWSLSKSTNKTSKSPISTPSRVLTTPKRSVNESSIIKTSSYSNSKKIKTPLSIEKKCARKKLTEFEVSPMQVSERNQRERKSSLTLEDVFEARQKKRRSSIEFIVTDFAQEEQKNPANYELLQVKTPTKIKRRSVHSPGWMSFEITDLVDSKERSSAEDAPDSNLPDEDKTKCRDLNRDSTSKVSNSETRIDNHESEDSDGDLEILQVIEPEESNSSSENEGSMSSDIDEASGSELDIIPCDETSNMFTDEENKRYHMKLVEEELKRKAEMIVEEDMLNYQRKLQKENDFQNRAHVKMNTNDVSGNHKTQSTVVDSDEPIQSEHNDNDLDNTCNMEVLLETIARDTGRMSSNICTDKPVQENDKEKALTPMTKKLDDQQQHLLANTKVNDHKDDDDVNGSADSEKENSEHMSPVQVQNNINSPLPRQVLTVNNNELTESEDKAASKALPAIEKKDNTPGTVNGLANESLGVESPDLEAIVPDKVTEQPSILKSDSSSSKKENLGVPVLPLKGEVFVDSVEEDSESTEGADEAYEASSDASEVPIPKVRKRTRSLRRSLVVQTAQQDASDSDASPVRKMRIQGVSEKEIITGKEGSCRQRTMSSSLEIRKTVPDTLKTLRRSSRLSLGSVIQNKVSKLDIRSSSDQYSTDLKSTSEIDSLISGNVTGEEVSPHLKDLKRSNNLVCDDKESGLLTRRSSRLAAIVAQESSKSKRRSLPSSKLSDTTDTVKTLATRVLTRNARRKSLSDSEVCTVQRASPREESLSMHGEKAREVSEYVTEVLSNSDSLPDSLSLGLDEDFSSSSLSCTLLQVDDEPILKSFNSNDTCLEKTEDTCKLCDVLMAEGTEDNLKECDIVVEENNVKECDHIAGDITADALKLCDSATTTCSRSPRQEEEKQKEKDLQETIATKICNQEISRENQSEGEASLPEVVDEELEVLSTSGVEETEELLSISPALFSPEKDQDMQISKSRTTNTSFIGLRSLSHRRSNGKGAKKEDSRNLKLDSPKDSSPKLKAQLVSEVILNKEILISPEVSDEECELVSPGVSETELQQESFSLTDGPDFSSVTKHTSSGTPVSQRTKKKRGSGIRSPEKVIPEEQDESLSILTRTLKLPKSRVCIRRLSNEELKESVGVVCSDVSAQEGNEIESPVNKSLEIVSEEIEVQTLPVLKSGENVQVTSDLALKDKEEAGSFSDAKKSPIRTRRSRRLSGFGTPEIKSIDNAPLRRTRRLSMPQRIDLKEESTAVSFSPRRSNRRKSLASSSSENTDNGCVPPFSEKASGGSSLENKPPKITEEDEESILKKDVVETIPSDSPRPRNSRASMLRSEIQTRSSPRNSSPARSTRSFTSKDSTPVRTSSRFSSRKVAPDRSPCVKDSFSETTPSKKEYLSPKKSSDRSFTDSDQSSELSQQKPMLYCQKEQSETVSRNASSDLLPSPATSMKSPLRSPRLRSPRQPSIGYKSPGNESLPKSPLVSPSTRSSVRKKGPEGSSFQPSPGKTGEMETALKSPSRSHNEKNTPLKSPASKTPNEINTPLKSPASKTPNEKNTPLKSPASKTPNEKNTPLKSPASKTPNEKNTPLKLPASKTPNEKNTPLKSPASKTPNENNAALKSPTSKTPMEKRAHLRSPVSKTPPKRRTPLRSPQGIKTPANLPENEILISPNVRKMPVRSPGMKKSPLRSPRLVVRTTPVNSPDVNKMPLRSSSQDGISLRSGSAKSTPVSQSPKSVVNKSSDASNKMSPRKNTTPSKGTATDGKDFMRDVEPVVTTRRLRGRQVTYKVTGS